MNPPACFDSAFCARVILTLAHFLWQGTVVALLAVLAATLLRRAAAWVRYNVYAAALLVMAVCPAATFTLLRPPATEAGGQEFRTKAQEPRSDVPPLGEPVVFALPSRLKLYSGELHPPVPTAIEPKTGSVGAPARFEWQCYAPHVVVAYLVGVIALLGRLLLALRGGSRLRKLSQPLDEPVLLAALERAIRTIGLKAAPAVAYCARVVVPTVVGVLQPTILLPLSFVSGLSPGQIEMILLHELAHIRRYDHLVNIAQRLIEAFLFFHPAVWLLSRRIRVERELCCDDLVIAVGGQPLAYASSLVEVAALSHTLRRQRRTAAAAAVGAADRPSQLRRRILRLLGGDSEPQVRLNRGWGVIVGLIFLLVLGAVAYVGTQQKPDIAAPTGAEGETRPGKMFTSDEVLAYHEKLTGEKRTAAELAKRYADDAIRAASSGSDPFILVEPIERALALNHDPATRGLLFTYLGDVHWLQTQKYTPEIWGPQRRKAAEAYLTGLREVLEYDLPAERPELPGVAKYDVDGPPEVVEPYRKKHEQEMAARKKAEFNSEMVQRRQVLTGQIVQMYAKEPDAFDELRDLLLKHLGGAEAADRLIAAAKDYRAAPKPAFPVLNSVGKKTFEPQSETDAQVTIAWGEVVRGLQASLRLEKGKGPYRFGDTVRGVFIVRNVGDRATTLSYVGPAFVVWEPTVHDANGNTVPLQGLMFPPVRYVARHPIAAGETIEIRDWLLEIQAPGWQGGSAFHVLCAAPGKYKVSVRFPFEGPVPRFWSGELKTGAVELEVVAASETASVDLTAAPFQKKVSVSYKDAPLADVVRSLARQAGLNIVMRPEDVRGRITVELNDVPVGEALRSILRTHGLDLVREADGIHRLVPSRGGGRVEQRTVHIPLAWIPASEAKKILEPIVGGSIAADTAGNALIITDTPLRIEQLTALSSGMDAPDNRRGTTDVTSGTTLTSGTTSAGVVAKEIEQLLGNPDFRRRLEQHELEIYSANLTDLGVLDPYAKTDGTFEYGVEDVLQTMLYHNVDLETARREGRRLWYDPETFQLTVVDRPENIRKVREFVESLPQLQAAPTGLVTRAYTVPKDLGQSLKTISEAVVSSGYPNDRKVILLERDEGTSLVVKELRENVRKVESLLQDQDLMSRLAKHELEVYTVNLTPRDVIDPQLETMPRDVKSVIEIMLYHKDGIEAARKQGRRSWFDPQTLRLTIVDTPENVRKVREFVESVSQVHEQPATVTGNQASFSLRVEDERVFRDLSVRLVRVDAKNPADENDDVAQLVVRTRQGQQKDLAIPEYRCEVFEDHEVYVERIAPSPTPGEGRVRLRVTHLPSLTATTSRLSGQPTSTSATEMARFESPLEFDKDIPVQLSVGRSGAYVALATESIQFRKAREAIVASVRIRTVSCLDAKWTVGIELLTADGRSLGRSDHVLATQRIIRRAPQTSGGYVHFPLGRASDLQQATAFRVTIERAPGTAEATAEPTRDPKPPKDIRPGQWAFVVMGTVTDTEGKPMGGVTVRAHCG